MLSFSDESIKIHTLQQNQSDQFKLLFKGGKKEKKENYSLFTNEVASLK